jgi:hypothetical protein
MCRSTHLLHFLDLGETPPADQFLFRPQLSQKEEYFPLDVLMCEGCGLAQLGCVVEPELLYCNDYPYESSTTSAGHRHWSEFAETTSRLLRLGSDDLIIDIGSNVGVLLSMFRKNCPKVLGIDPAANIAAIANKNGIETIAGFFNKETAACVVASHGKAKVITGTNVFAHIHDLDDFMEAVDILLHDKGALVIEAPSFSELIRNLEYDTIYHEHLSYLSLKPMHTFFKRFDMEVFDVQLRDIHGGSMRTFVRRKSASAEPVATIIRDVLAAEERDRIYEPETLHRFAAAVAKNRDDLRTLLLGIKKNGQRIAGVSAPAKGMTLLNYCGIGNDILDFVTEKSKLKIGRFTPGTHIEVMPDSALIEKKPEFALLLAWNFAEEIMNNLKAYSETGGRFIIPIPTPRIVG